MNKPLILVVEDDAPVRNLITTTLKANDYRFQTAANGEAGVLATASQNPDIILLDLGLLIWTAWRLSKGYAAGRMFPLL